MVEIEESKRKSDQSTIPIKKTQLELDDLPPQLLSKHQELILKQVSSSWARSLSFAVNKEAWEVYML